VGATISTSALPAITSKVPHNSIERAMYAVDLDGDGNSELVATFGPGPKAAAAGPGVVLVCDVASGVPQPCADVATAVVAVAPDIATCVDAAPGHFAYRDPFTTSAGPGTDLVVLCFDTAAVGSLFRVTRDPAGFHAELVDHGVGALRSIRVGDVTGDGVDDVIAIQGVGSEESLVVFRQCTSRDTTCGKASKR
jgi:hypothetical protein